VQFFNLINGLAGRNDLVDMALRLFYVSAVPLLATALAALLFLRPRREDRPSPWRILAAAAVAIVFMEIVTAGIGVAGSKVLNAEIVAPRPFLTHWVNELVVEPNDNAFPCAEVMLTASLAVLMWAAEPTAGICGLCYMLVFGFTRIYCGSNFPQDIVAGAVLGIGFGILSLAMCRVSLRWNRRDLSTFVWQPRSEAIWSVAGLAAIVCITAIVLARSPRFADKLHQLIHEAKATADPLPAPPKPAPQPTLAGAIGPEANMHEGGDLAGKYELQPAKVQDGHVPEAEQALRAEMANLNAPHKVISAEVGEIDTGEGDYRSDLVRFEIGGSGPGERKRVMETAEAIVKRTFAFDSKAQHVDVIGVVVNGKKVSGQRLVFTPGIIPVFTASIERSRLEASGADAWTNAPGADAGSWLRARSLLYIDPMVLPGESQAAAPAVPALAATPSASGTEAAPPAPSSAASAANAASASNRTSVNAVTPVATRKS